MKKHLKKGKANGTEAIGYNEKYKKANSDKREDEEKDNNEEAEDDEKYKAKDVKEENKKVKND